MAIEPRERYEDLIVEREQHWMEPDDFRRNRDSEAFRSDWVVAAVTLDDRGLAPFGAASGPWRMGRADAAATAL